MTPSNSRRAALAWAAELRWRLAFVALLAEGGAPTTDAHPLDLSAAMVREHLTLTAWRCLAGVRA